MLATGPAGLPNRRPVFYGGNNTRLRRQSTNGVSEMRIGFIGVGNIATAVARGLCRATPAPDRVLLSPRNAGKAAALAAEFAQAEVMADNQAVIDGSDVVILAVRPPHAGEVLGALRFRPDLKVISLIAAVRFPDLCKLVAPATDVVRAVPLPPVAQHIGPTAIYPADPATTELFDRIGTAVPVTDEHQFDALATITAVAASQYALMSRLSAWLVAEGVDGKSADRYVTAVAHAVAVDGAEAVEHGFDALIKDVSTPGGMNEQILRMLTEAGWFEPLKPALDAILARHEGRA